MKQCVSLPYSDTRKLSFLLTQAMRGMAVLILSALVFPLAAIVCFSCFLFVSAAAKVTGSVTSSESHSNRNRKCILILGGAKGKALHLARLFKAEGYKTVVAENELYPFPGSSFSRCVDVFRSLPSPVLHREAYTSAILGLVTEHRPHLLVPLDPRTVHLDLQVLPRLPGTCFPLVSDPVTFAELDDKASFMDALERCGVAVKKARLVKSKQEAYDILKRKSRQFVFKPVLYDNVTRANIFPPEDLAELERYLENSQISAEKPYVVQERLIGPEMTSVSLVLNGKILALSVGFSSSVHQTQNQVDCPEIEGWMEQFVQAYPRELTGWYTMDYMLSPLDGRYYPLECNPRLGTNFMLFTHRQGIVPLLEDEVDRRRQTSGGRQPGSGPSDASSSSSKAAGQFSLGPQHRQAARSQSATDSSTTDPARSARLLITPECKQLYYLMNVLWVLLSNPLDGDVWRRYLGVVWRGAEGTFSVWDPLPFLALNFLQMPVMVVRAVLAQTPWNIVDYNIGSLKMG